MGGLLASVVAETMNRRGFGPNDPRTLLTVGSIGARVPVVAAATGTGATWLSTISRISPWVTGGLLIYQGVSWYMDLQGKVYLAPPGSASSAPVFSNGIVAGQMCWGISGDCFGSPQEVLSFLFATTKAQYPSAAYGVPQLVSNSATQWTATYNYSIPEIFLNNYSGTKVIVLHLSSTTCLPGFGYSGAGATPSTCVNASLNNSPYAGAPVVGVTPKAAYDALPAAAKSAMISPAVVAQIANGLWKEAASQPDYQGVPWSPSMQVTPEDMLPASSAHPADMPSTSALDEPVPTTGPSPVALPTTNPNQTTAPSTATKVDLGADPGTPPPTLEDLPSDLMKPIKDVMQPWLSWQVPSHGASCPTWHAAPSVSGKVRSWSCQNPS
ncbi:hypothetical protein Jab_1c04260 [Janthinobacterium sp. HH01]|nr:hypothetical protein Jab_1c04260 [Janthinobacterium sp. HH01]